MVAIHVPSTEDKEGLVSLKYSDQKNVSVVEQFWNVIDRGKMLSTRYTANFRFSIRQQSDDIIQYTAIFLQTSCYR